MRLLLIAVPLTLAASPALAAQLSGALEQAVKDPEYMETVKRLTYQPVFLGPEGLRQMAKSFETEIGPKLESAFPVKK